jgi:hypothetical protein
MKVFKNIVIIFLAVAVTVGLVWLAGFTTTTRQSTTQKEASGVADTIILDARTGLIKDKNLTLVIANCTACHSTRLIQQHRFSREGWIGKIRWMQKNHNLWDLGKSEKSIMDYLEKYYSPASASNKVQARRAPLENIKWYKL